MCGNTCVATANVCLTNLACRSPSSPARCPFCGKKDCLFFWVHTRRQSVKMQMQCKPKHAALEPKWQHAASGCGGGALRHTHPRSRRPSIRPARALSLPSEDDSSESTSLSKHFPGSSCTHTHTMRGRGKGHHENAVSQQERRERGGRR